MMEKIKNWIIGLFKDEVQKWLKDAYDCGYKIGEEDAIRRCHDLFMYGVIQGYTDAKAEVPEIDVDDLTDEDWKELKDGAENV